MLSRCGRSDQFWIACCKTEVSQKPVPNDEYMAADLLESYPHTPYHAPADWVFATDSNRAGRKRGKQPLWLFKLMVMGRPGTYSMTKNGRPSGVAPASKTLAMLGLLHERQGLTLGLESGHNGAGVHAHLNQLECINNDVREADSQPRLVRNRGKCPVFFGAARRMFSARRISFLPRVEHSYLKGALRPLR